MNLMICVHTDLKICILADRRAVQNYRFVLEPKDNHTDILHSKTAAFVKQDVFL